MKRTLAIILTAVFLSALSIPCGATGTETTASRVYPGFSDVAEGSASYEAIKLCYERGLMNGASDTAFNPQGKLTVAAMRRGRHGARPAGHEPALPPVPQ